MFKTFTVCTYNDYSCVAYKISRGHSIHHHAFFSRFFNLWTHLTQASCHLLYYLDVLRYYRRHWTCRNLEHLRVFLMSSITSLEDYTSVFSELKSRRRVTTRCVDAWRSLIYNKKYLNYKLTDFYIHTYLSKNSPTNQYLCTFPALAWWRHWLSYTVRTA